MPATLLKKRLLNKCFPVNFAKFLRIPFSKEHLRWLLLKKMTYTGTHFHIRVSILRYWYGEKNNNKHNNNDSNDDDNQKYVFMELFTLNILNMKTLNFFWFCDPIVSARKLVILTSNSAALNCPKNIFRRAFPRRNTITNAWT